MHVGSCDCFRSWVWAGSVDDDASLHDSDVELLSGEDADSCYKAMQAVKLEEPTPVIEVDDDGPVKEEDMMDASAPSEPAGQPSKPAHSEPSQSSEPPHSEPSQSSEPAHSEPSQASEPPHSEPSQSPEPSAPPVLRRSGAVAKGHTFDSPVLDVEALDATSCSKCGRKQSKCRCLMLKQLQQSIATLKSHQAARERRPG